MIRFFDNSISSECGSDIKVLYSPVVNDDGIITLVPSGKENIQEIIDSHSDEVDINVLIARFQAGDTSVLNKRAGQYGDFTQFPKTYAEILQLEINSRNFFDSLPVEVKQKFNNDANQFFAQTGSEEWQKIMSTVYPSETKVDDLVVEKESKKEVASE